MTSSPATPRALAARRSALTAAVLALVAACTPAPVQVLAGPTDEDAGPSGSAPDATSDRPDGGGFVQRDSGDQDLIDSGDGPDAGPREGLPDTGVIPLCGSSEPSQDAVRGALVGVQAVGPPARITGAGERIHVVGLTTDGAFSWTLSEDATTPVPHVPLGLLGMTHVESVLPNPIDDSPLPTFRSDTNGASWNRGQAAFTLGVDPVESYVLTPEGLVLVTRSSTQGAVTHHVHVGTDDPIDHLESVGPYYDVRGMVVGGQAWLVSRQNWDFPDTIFVQSAQNGTWMWGPRGTAYDVDATVVRGVPRFFVVADGPTGIDFAMVQPTDDAPVHVSMGGGVPTVPSRVAWSAQRNTVLVGTALDAERIALHRLDAEAAAIGDPHVLRNPSAVSGAQLRWFALSALQDRWAVLMGVDEGLDGYLTLYVSEVSFCP